VLRAHRRRSDAEEQQADTECAQCPLSHGPECRATTALESREIEVAPSLCQKLGSRVSDPVAMQSARAPPQCAVRVLAMPRASYDNSGRSCDATTHAAASLREESMQNSALPTITVLGAAPTVLTERLAASQRGDAAAVRANHAACNGQCAFTYNPMIPRTQYCQANCGIAPGPMRRNRQRSQGRSTAGASNETHAGQRRARNEAIVARAQPFALMPVARAGRQSGRWRSAAQVVGGAGLRGPRAYDLAAQAAWLFVRGSARNT
jgi:hypothetical protein